MAAPDAPQVSVLVATRNRADLLRRFLRSLDIACTTAAFSVECLVVDNGSTDHTAKVAAKFAADDPRVKFFREPQPGISVARNLALRHAAGDWVIFIDDDATAEAGWLAAYENFFLHLPNPRVAVTGWSGLTCSTRPRHPSVMARPTT